MKIIFQDNDGRILREEVIDLEDETALLTNMIDITEWTMGAVREKARKRIDDIVTRSGRGSKYTDPVSKKAIIADLIACKSELIQKAKDVKKDL
jgi:alpha-galactosidase/6-phospho-beta-glucosidase family protein